jgi:hypothetical protein
MSAGSFDLTEEEWDALQRIHRGPPESQLVPSTVVGRLVEIGLAVERNGRRRVSENGRKLILRRRDDAKVLGPRR